MLEEAQKMKREENNKRFGFDSDYINESALVEKKVNQKKSKVVARIPPKKIILSSEELEI